MLSAAERFSQSKAIWRTQPHLTILGLQPLRDSEPISVMKNASYYLYSNATLENVFYSASASRIRHQEQSRMQTVARRLKPFTSVIEQYGLALDVYVNVSGMILAPIWGTLRVLFQVLSSLSWTSLIHCGKLSGILDRQLFRPLLRPIN